VVKALDLKEGDDVTIIAADERELAIKRKPTSAELVERLRKYEGRLPADFKFDRLEANAR
jgi:antitoxin MazE